MTKRSTITIIAAMAENRVIGRAGGIPWDIPADRQHFKELTWGQVLIMGRRTFESIGRALPGRRTIVVTGDPGWASPGCERAPSLDAALALCADAPQVFICGGAALYTEALPLAHRLVLTLVPGTPEGDTLFPPIPDRFRETSRTMLAGTNKVPVVVFEHTND